MEDNFAITLDVEKRKLREQYDREKMALAEKLEREGREALQKQV